jgi:homoserine kinase
VVTPEFELPTREARAVLPAEVTLQTMVKQSARLASLVSALHTADMALLGRCLVDEVVTPRRAALVPGAPEAMAAALGAGALGSSLSGSGPSVFALCRSPRSAEVAATAMGRAFETAGLASQLRMSPADGPGVRRVRGVS